MIRTFSPENLPFLSSCLFSRIRFCLFFFLRRPRSTTFFEPDSPPSQPAAGFFFFFLFSAPSPFANTIPPTSSIACRNLSRSMFLSNTAPVSSRFAPAHLALIWCPRQRPVDNVARRMFPFLFESQREDSILYAFSVKTVSLPDFYSPL